MAQRHVDLWEWLEHLARGVQVRPYVAIWGRGGGKSSTVEMGVARVGARQTRRFALYVCGTQDSADKHVSAIGTKLEALGAERATNIYGVSKGWRKNQLRTANGFNVAGIGLDVAQRGAKLDDYRPDLIIFDDIDGRHDSQAVIAKKIEVITESLLPMGSPDCAVLFVQNKILANGVASQMADGRADFLLNRLPVKVHPAVEGLVYKTVWLEDGTPTYEITGGTATWAGQPLAVCQQQINTWGLRAFLREAQHNVHLSGSLFFQEYEGLDFIAPRLDGRHVVTAKDLEPWWTYIAGLDWGWRAPFCFLLGAVDENVNVDIVDEIYQPGLTNPKQADAVCRLLEKRGIPKNKVMIACDPSMWSQKAQADGTSKADIEDFQARGLICVRANNDRQHGWNNVREYLEPQGGLELYKGCCPNLIRTMATATHSKTCTEDLDDDDDIPPGHMDAVNTLRYLLSLRVRGARKPSEPGQGRARPFRDELMGGEKKRRL